MFDVLIVGAGAGGLSAALQLARSNRSVLVFDRGKQRTLWAHKFENYLGFLDGISGKDLLEIGRKQAQAFGATIIQAEVSSVAKTGDGNFKVAAGDQSYFGKRIILATGVKDNMPQITGVMNFMGITVAHCLDCDGYEFINKRAVVFGAGNGAADGALRILSFTQQVFIATNGEALSMNEKYRQKLQENGIEIIENNIAELQGTNHRLEKVTFVDGSEREADFGYSTSGSKPHNELALSLGVETLPNGHILVNKDMETSEPNVYAVGDIINSSQQVSLAVAQGVRAAIMLNKTLLAENQTIKR
ncbi:MAG: NAD(P)/FAD-dependent oxidoreductase [Peptococcaceae bacterium]|nr:NAD(P)/FAD-dependent oxidoreductase [Peptococcaceae bacterium]